MHTSTEHRKLARHTDPITSHESAALVGEFSGAHCARILAAIRKLGMAGAEQIAREVGLDAYQVRKRIVSLSENGYVRLTGDTRKTSTGRSERVWVAV